MHRTYAMLLTIIPLLLSVVAADTALAEDNDPPDIQHTPCSFYRKGRRFEVKAKLFDASPIFDPKVQYRSKRDSGWRAIPLARGVKTGVFKAFIPSRDLRGPLEYFIEAFDENGNGPSQAGTPDEPNIVLPSDNPPSCSQVRAAPPAVADSGVEHGADDSDSAPMDNGTTDGNPEADDADSQGQNTDAHAAIVPLTDTGDAPQSDAFSLNTTPQASRGCGSRNAPFYCSPWVWGTAGAVVLAAGAASVYYWGVRSSGGDNPRSSVVNIRVSGDVPGAEATP